MTRREPFCDLAAGSPAAVPGARHSDRRFLTRLNSDPFGVHSMSRWIGIVNRVHRSFASLRMTTIRRTYNPLEVRAEW
jgi:hypothetical protein